MRKLMFASLLLLAACDDMQMPNQCIRREVFKECMAALPKGPEVTHYNDWNEVVESCNEVARNISYRTYGSIPKECK
jgi:hypothetical protein